MPGDETYSYPSTFPGLVGLVLEELERATAKFGPIASTHEGYAVILEELDEFWEGVKTKGTTPDFLRAELIQVAAMALRTIHDCVGRGLRGPRLVQPRSSTSSAGGSVPVTTTAAQTVELPPGVKHWTTTATAETWEAWDALTSADGWELREWDVAPNVASPDGRHVQKEALIRGHRIVVFRPLREREEGDR